MLASVRKRSLIVSIQCLIVLMFLNASFLYAFNLRPEETTGQGQIRALEPFKYRFLDDFAKLFTQHFTDPAHEEITNRIYGCEGTSLECSRPSKPDAYASGAIIAGIRWNDNPPFRIDPGQTRYSDCPEMTIRLPNFSGCWYALFKDAKRRASNGEHLNYNTSVALIYRVHFGDLQFLHSMASWEGEPANTTASRILMWAEFTYKLSLGQIKQATILKDTGVKGMEVVFKNKGWSVENLFTLGDQTFRTSIPDVAFGSLLHMVEDSFSIAHVARSEPTGQACSQVPDQKAPGKIQNFRAYNDQDSKKHGEYDSSNALAQHLISFQPNVVSIGKVIKAYRENKSSWEDLKSYLECVYDLEDPDAPGEAGAALK